jgi:transaldolase
MDIAANIVLADLSTPQRLPNPAQRLAALGQSIWLDDISRTLIDSGTLARYMREGAVTGLTSNPSIYERALHDGTAYDAAIGDGADRGLAGEALFFELAVADLRRAADLFLPVHRATAGVDGWVSLEVSPLLCDDSDATITAAHRLHARVARPNLFIKIPGNAAGLVAIEESIFAGIPVNVTLLFSCDQFLAAAAAWQRGLERRVAAGLKPDVASVASLFVSRWDAAVNGRVSGAFRNRLGIAMAMRTYAAWRETLTLPRWQRLARAGARPQRLLWASTGTKDPTAADALYVEALAAPGTVTTLPTPTLLAFIDHGRPDRVLPVDGGYAEATLSEFTREGIDLERLAAGLQRDGAAKFTGAWRDMLHRLDAKAAHSLAS